MRNTTAIVKLTATSAKIDAADARKNTKSMRNTTAIAQLTATSAKNDLTDARKSTKSVRNTAANAEPTTTSARTDLTDSRKQHDEVRHGRRVGASDIPSVVLASSRSREVDLLGAGQNNRPP